MRKGSIRCGCRSPIQNGNVQNAHEYGKVKNVHEYGKSRESKRVVCLQVVRSMKQPMLADHAKVEEEKIFEVFFCVSNVFFWYHVMNLVTV